MNPDNASYNIGLLQIINEVGNASQSAVDALEAQVNAVAEQIVDHIYEPYTRNYDN